MESYWKTFFTTDKIELIFIAKLRYGYALPESKNRAEKNRIIFEIHQTILK